MKFRIRNEGGEEFEFEGDEKDFSVVVGQLDGRLFDPGRPRDGAHRRPPAGPSPTSGQPRSGETMTTNAIAVRLGCIGGSDLFLAAATRLTFYDEKEAFTRSEVLREMKSAASFFVENHRKNLSTYCACPLG